MPVDRLLEVREVSKAYGTTQALTGLSLTLEAGESLCLLGPNGAGKTTLVSMIAGLFRPDSGSISIEGVRVTDEPDRARTRLGLAPQDLGLYPTLSVATNIHFFGELRGLSGKLLHREAELAMTAMGISHLASRNAGELSGGEKRRVHSAIALLGSPRLIVLDEPTSGVDVATRRLVLDAVRELRDRGAGVLYCTHYLEEVEQLDGRVIIINRGQTVAQGTVTGLVSAHGTPFVRLLFDGDAPHIRGFPELSQSGDTLTIPTDEPHKAIQAVFSQLDSELDRLRSVEIVRPKLESVFLRLIESHDTALLNDAS